MPDTGATFNLLVNENYPAVEGEVIDDLAHNAMLEDIAAGLTARVTRDGAGVMSGNLNMGSHKLTNLLAGSGNGDSVRYEQVQLANAVATAWEGLSWAANKMGYATSASAFALVDTTAAGRAVLNFTDPNADRLTYWRDSDGTWQPVTLAAQFSFSGGTLSLDADLGTWAGLTPSAFFQTLVDDADAATFRASIGNGTAATQNTGTSGATVGLNNGNNTLSGAILATGGLSVTTAAFSVQANGGNVAQYRTNTGNSHQVQEYWSGSVFNFGPAPSGSLNTGKEFGVDASTGGWFFDEAPNIAGSPAVSRSATETLTNKTFALGSNSLSGTTAQFNTALSDGDFATLAGTETLTNKTVNGAALSGTMSGTPTFNGAIVLTGQPHFNNGTGARNMRISDNGTLMSFWGAQNSGNFIFVVQDASTNNILLLTGGGVMTLNGVNVVTTTSTDTLTNKSIRTPVSSETSGTLTSASSNKTVQATGDVTINDGVHTAEDRIEIYAGGSARSIVQDTGMTLRLDGTSTTGTRSLPARGRASVYFVSNSEAIVSGMGVT